MLVSDYNITTLMKIVGTLILLLTSAALGNDQLFDGARKGDVAVVRAALGEGADVNAKWRYDQTALFIAVFHGHTPVAKLLIDRGADVNVKDSFYGISVFDAAASKNNVELVRLLLDHGVKAEDRSLIGVAEEGSAAVLKLLLARDWKPEALAKARAAAETSNKTENVALLKAAEEKKK